jgi:hypothetical protein
LHGLTQTQEEAEKLRDANERLAVENKELKIKISNFTAVEKQLTD